MHVSGGGMPGSRVLECEHFAIIVMLSQPKRRNIWGGAFPPRLLATRPPQTPRYTWGDRSVISGIFSRPCTSG